MLDYQKTEQSNVTIFALKGNLDALTPPIHLPNDCVSLIFTHPDVPYHPILRSGLPCGPSFPSWNMAEAPVNTNGVDTAVPNANGLRIDAESLGVSTDSTRMVASVVRRQATSERRAGGRTFAGNVVSHSTAVTKASNTSVCAPFRTSRRDGVTPWRTASAACKNPSPRAMSPWPDDSRASASNVSASGST